MLTEGWDHGAGTRVRLLSKSEGCILHVTGQGTFCWYFCGMKEQRGGSGTFLIQWEKTQALGAQIRALHYFTEAKWAFLNLLKSKDLQSFLIWAPAAREWAVPVGRHWHKCLPTAWDAVCVFWFSFLIIFLQSVPRPPSGALWIVDCPWAPRSSAELDDC